MDIKEAREIIDGLICHGYYTGHNDPDIKIAWEVIKMEVDKQYIKEQLFKLSHELFGILAGIHDIKYEETHAGLLLCLDQLTKLILTYHQWNVSTGGVAFKENRTYTTKEQS